MSISTRTKAKPPRSLSSTVSLTNGFAVNLTWTPIESGAPRSYFVIYRDGEQLTSGVTVSTFRDSSVSGGEVHSYNVSTVLVTETESTPGTDTAAIIPGYPVWETGWSISMKQSSTVPVAFRAYDLLGYSLTFSKVSGPSGVSVSSSGDVSSGTAQSGDYTLIIRADNGSLYSDISVPLSVVAENRPPVFTVSPIRADLVPGGTVQFTAVDPEGLAVSYRLTTTRTGITINSSTGLVTVALGSAGSSGSITVEASDGLLTTSVSCDVYVDTPGTILWNGDFSTGNFTQWPNNDSNLNNVGLLFCPPRGAPRRLNLPSGKTYSYRSGSWTMDGQAYTWNGIEGDGSNVNLVRTASATFTGYDIGNTRGSSQYAGRFVAKARPPSSGGTDGTGKEPDDGDIVTLDLDRRRTELQGKNPVIRVYSPNVHLKTRWYSISIFNPSNQPALSGTTWGGGWGPSHYGLLKLIQRPGGVLNILRDPTSNGWEIATDHSDNPNTLSTDPLSQWYETCRYRPSTPTDDAELIPDFPDQAKSIAALSDPNIGGWTDFVIKIKFDYRTPSVADGGTGAGQLDVWMRAGSSAAIDASPQPWVHVIQQLPKVLARTALINLNRGIGFNFVDGNNGGSVGPYIGNYISKDNVWGMPRDFVTHIANCKIGDDNCSFSQMTPDGSSL